jgi:phosphatidylserine/phosphatidylglycerophosphate/cardiolipin synthase-like enzyme
MFIENMGQFDSRVRFQAAEDATIYFTDHDIWFVLLEPRTISEEKGSRGNQRLDSSFKADTPRKGVNLKLDFVGAKPRNQIEGLTEVETTISYFAGSGQESQYANVPAWNEIRYTDIYPGMDLEVSAEGNDLSWNFVMTDPALFFEKYGKNNKQEIRIRIRGQKDLEVQNNEILVSTDVQPLIIDNFKLNGNTVTFVLEDNGEITIPVSNVSSTSQDFAFTSHHSQEEDQSIRDISNDPSQLLAAQDQLLYATYFGGSDWELGYAIDTDATGAIYFAGDADSTGFPQGEGVFTAPSGSASYDTFVAKLDPNTNRLIYTAFFQLRQLCLNVYAGGIASIAVDSTGSVYAVGTTSSQSFPFSVGVIDTELTGTCTGTPKRIDGFALKLNPAGNGLVYATFLGGSDSDSASGIWVDANQEAYIVGSTLSTDFPDFADGYDQIPNGDWDVSLTKIDATATNQEYFTYIGGAQKEDSYGAIAVDSAGIVYLAGVTESNNFPKFNAYDPVYQGETNCSDSCWDGFAIKLDSNSTNVPIYSTFLGGTGRDLGFGISVDPVGSAYVALNVLGYDSFPTSVTLSKNNPPVTSTAGSVIIKLDPTGGLVYDTRLVGSSVASITVDSSGNAYVAGNALCSYFPTTPGSFDPIGSGGDNWDVFVAKLSPQGTSLDYSTCYDTGSTINGEETYSTEWIYALTLPVDSDGNAYLLISDVESDVAPLKNPYATYSGGTDMVIAKLSTTAYGCSGTTLSPIAEAVLAETGVQEFCGNQYDDLITLPPGQVAFEKFATLAKNIADEHQPHEIDFMTMVWDPYNSANGDNAGRIFLQGIKTLYEKVHANPTAYQGGVKVRILLGLKYYQYTDCLDQRVYVMNDLNYFHIPRTELNWTVEIAHYRDVNRDGCGPDQLIGGNHSHVKMMIVDGKIVIAGGYNLQYGFIESENNPNPGHDMGVQISGPIAQSALKVFDGLWAGAYRCEDDGCSSESVIWAPIDHNPSVLIPSTLGNNVAFSLFRDDVNKTADNAIAAAIEAASSEVNIIQNRFMNNYWFPAQYARSVLNVLEKQNTLVRVNLLVSGAGLIEDVLNIPGVCALKQKLLHEAPSRLQYLQTKYSPSNIHTKALSIDGSFVIVGSQNFDYSAWGNNAFPSYGDLAEYSLAVDSSTAWEDFESTFAAEWGNSSPLICILDPNLLLQDAIDQASPGSALFIPAGVYTESITINKPLVLVGAGANQTIIQAQGNQPAFRVTSSDVTILNMTISGGAGYGVELIDSSPSSLKNIQISRVVFENNTQGGVLAQGLISGSPMNYSVENSTFIGGASGVAINMGGTQADTSYIRNNIFYGQSHAPVHILSTNDSHVEYSYNLFDDCGLGACAANWRQGNMSTSSSEHDNLFDQNPFFANPANGAYQLSSGSPAIDAGDPSLLHDTFFDGDNDGTIQIDMGAFEYVPVTNVAPVVNAGNDQTVNLGSGVTVNTTYSDADTTENHSARINWGDGVIEDVAVNMTGPGAGEVTGGHAYSNTGNYTVEVCVTDLYGAVGCDAINVQVVSTPTACTSSNAYGFSPTGGAKFANLTASDISSFNRLPLSFVPNRGQEDQAVRFQAQGLGGSLFFTPSEIVFSLPNPVKVKEDDKEKIRYDRHPANVVRIHYQGANDNPEVAALEELPGVVNILKGNDPSKWQTNLPTYAGIVYRELYPGIELRYEGTDGNLKSTFYVAPGVNPASIVWRYKGASDLNVDESGNLVVSLPEPAGSGAKLIEQAPIAWQEVNGNRVMVPVQYVVDAKDKKDKKVSFLFPNGYDSTLPLVIDPTLSYSSYLGGGATDQAEAVTLDGDCNIYLTGVTYSANFPTVNPIQTNQPAGDVFVSKLNAAGDTLLFSTYIGGGGGDHALNIARDSQGRITVVGETESTNFPTVNAYQTSYGGGTCPDDACDDVFVTQLAADGSALRYSTYLGGNQDEEGHGIIIGPDDMVYLTGWSGSSTFPTTANAYDTFFGGGTCSGAPCEDVFVAKVNPAVAGSNSLLYSTFLGGNNYDKAFSLALDASAHVYVTGYTRSDDYPTRNPSQATRAGSSDVFVSKLDTTLSGDASLLDSTYFGGSGTDYAYGIALNGANQVYLTGWTRSTNFPLTNAFDNTFGGGTCGSSACSDAFVTHLDIASNIRVYSSYLGGSNEEEGRGITVDDNGNAYVTGYTKSTDFTTLAAIQGSKGTDSCSAPPCADAFVTKVNSAGALAYSTYLGGTAEDYGNAIVLDGMGGTYIVGYTFSSNFPAAINPFTGTSGYADAFVVKIED